MVSQGLSYHSKYRNQLQTNSINKWFAENWNRVRSTFFSHWYKYKYNMYKFEKIYFVGVPTTPTFKWVWLVWCSFDSHCNQLVALLLFLEGAKFRGFSSDYSLFLLKKDWCPLHLADTEFFECADWIWVISVTSQPALCISHKSHVKNFLHTKKLICRILKEIFPGNALVKTCKGIRRVPLQRGTNRNWELLKCLSESIN